MGYMVVQLFKEYFEQEKQTMKVADKNIIREEEEEEESKSEQNDQFNENNESNLGEEVDKTDITESDSA